MVQQGLADAAAALGDIQRMQEVLRREEGGEADDPTALDGDIDLLLGRSAQEILRRRGIEPGRDFAVVGFDDVVEARHYVPTLSSVSVDTPGLGERAAHAVLKMIQSRTTRAEDHIGAVNLVVRESSGPDRNIERGNAA